MKSFRPKIDNKINKPEASVVENTPVQQSWQPNRPNHPNPPQHTQSAKQLTDSVRLISLGGVGDVTKNMYVYEYKDDIVIIDCGVSFPDEAMPGIDLVIPDISYLRDKKHKIKGMVITHGHDDHYGALPFIWPELDVPIYSQKFTCGLIKGKFTEHNLPKDKIKELKIDDSITLGAFKISFYQVSHSVPDSTGIVLETPAGRIIHQSDFKVDWTPVNGQVVDVARVAEVGKMGVSFMTIDCLRSEKKGYNLSEKTIEPTFEKIEAETKGRLLITLITSNITRVQQAVNVAVKSGRKIVFAGRSMENNTQVARDLGYLDVPPGLIIAQEASKRFADDKLMIIIAGSLGQPGSALDRVARGEHKFIRVSPKDTVVFSADPMPSAEESQGVLIDRLSQIGCKVYYSTLTEDLHVSGHAAQEELKLMINLAKPQNLMGIGGGFKHIRAFGEMARDLGYKDYQIIAPNEVCAIEIKNNQARIGEKIKAENVYVDGYGIGDVGNIILNDRRLMSEEGVVVVSILLDKQTGVFKIEPDIISRGFVLGEETQDLIDAAGEIVKSILSERRTGPFDFKDLRHQIEKSLARFFLGEIKRSPLILTLIKEI